MTLRLASLAQGTSLRPFESLRVAPSTVEGRLAPLAQGRSRLRSFAASARQAFATGVAVLICGGSSVFACPMCVLAEETSTVNGTKIGVLVMLAITLVVQGGFVGFFLYLRKRAKRIADVELDTEWSELQRSPRTS